MTSDNSIQEQIEKSFQECLQPVSLEELENQEFYAVYGVYRHIKIANSCIYKECIKNDYISIFNNTGENVGYSKNSFPSYIVLCKVSTLSKDDVLYDKDKDAETYNLKYNKKYYDKYDNFNSKTLKFEENEPLTFTKTVDDGINIYIYNYYYIQVCNDVIYRNYNNSNHYHVDTAFNESCFNNLMGKQNSFTKDMLMYFHSYIIKKTNSAYIPYVDIATFFHQKCQQDLGKVNITQQEFINKIKWYYDIVDKAFNSEINSSYDVNKMTELDCLAKTHTPEQIEMVLGCNPEITSNLIQNTRTTNIKIKEQYKYLYLDNHELKKPDVWLDINSIKKEIKNVYTHTFGKSNWKFHPSDVIGYTWSMNKVSVNKILPGFKKSRVLDRHLSCVTPNEVKLINNGNKSKQYISNSYYRRDGYTYHLIQQYLYIIKFINTMKNLSNAKWFKFDYSIQKKINDKQEVNLYVNYTMYFHNSLNKYLNFDDSKVIKLDKKGVYSNLFTLIKFLFGYAKPYLELVEQHNNENILASYYSSNDSFTKYYKPLLNKEYYENNYDNLNPNSLMCNNIVKLNDEENSASFNLKLENYFETHNLNNTINIPLFNYQKRNVIWMSEMETQVDNNQLYVNSDILNVVDISKTTDINTRFNNCHGTSSCFNNLAQYVININNKPCYYYDNKPTYGSSYNYTPHNYFINTTTNTNTTINDVDTVFKNVNYIKPFTNENKPYKLQLSGGILCDDVGLGKTLSTISHLVNMKKKDMEKLKNEPNTYHLNNLIILPPRLLKQWAFEIEKYVGTEYFNIKIIASITDIKKMYKPQKKKTKVAKKTTKRGRKSKKVDTTETETNVEVTEETETNVEVETEAKEKSTPKNEPIVIEKADIYLMSINILNNNNYMKYIYESYEKALDKYEMTKSPDEPQDDFTYDINTYFDIFQIKWNRVIIDEVHECVSNIFTNDYKFSLTLPKRKLVKNIIYNIQSNYRWGLSATPFQKGIYNNYGYISWLSKEMKINTLDMNNIKRLYRNNLSMFNNESNIVYQLVDHINYYFRSDETQEFQFKCISKTRKRDVEKELDIPIVSEEIIPITLGNIEMNIYNSAKSQVNTGYRYGYNDRLKRLFQLCTNICISEEDITNMGIDINNPVSLEELNKAMITTFTKQLKMEEKKIADLKKRKENFADYSQLFKKLKEFTGGLVDNTSQGYNELFGWVRDESRHVYYSENERNNWSKFYRIFKAEVLDRIEICKENSTMLLVIISEIMCLDEVKKLNIDTYFNDARLLILADIIINNTVKNSYSSNGNIKKDIETCEREIVRLGNQIKLFENNDFMKEKTQEPCPICWCDFEDDTKAIITKCRHVLCVECFENLMNTSRVRNTPCPECREPISKSSVITVKVGEINETEEEKKKRLEKETKEKEEKDAPKNIEDWENDCVSKYGTKMKVLIKYLKKIFSEVDEEGNNKGHRAIVFSQYENMLKLIGKTLKEFQIKNVYAKGNVHVLNKNIDAFKRDESIRVIMLSSEHSNSGSNLTEASHIIMVDVLNMEKNQSREVETQAIGRAVRLGQKKPVKIVRLITQNTIESEYYEKNKYDLVPDKR